MPVLEAYFLHALFADMQRYKDCANEQKEMPAFIPFLASIYIMNARTFIISYLKYHDLLASPRSSLFSSFPILLIFCEFAPNRPSARKFANYEAFKIPISVLMQAFALIFWLSILLLPLVPSFLVRYSDGSLSFSLPRFLVLS